MEKGNTKITYKQAMTDAHKEEMLRDERVIVMGEDIVLHGNSELIGMFDSKRIWNTPISENAFTGMAVGAAMTGLRPVVDLTVASFTYLASDQIINQASKLRYMTGGQMQVPAVFRCCMYYNLGMAAQHSDRPYSMFMNSPGLKILLPSSPANMKGLLKSAIRDNDPVLIFEDVNLWDQEEWVSTDPEVLIPIGEAEIKRQGTDITIVAIGATLNVVLEAAQALEIQGISAEVIDPRTLVPLDTETLITSVRKTGRLIIVDNAHRTASVGSEIAAIIVEKAFKYLKAPIQRVTTPDVHVPYSPPLEALVYPNCADILAAATIANEH
ncbi:MAG TPA: alpha-ketoacid dehydrogenase subunit beta [Rhodobacteraceae bacterium]|nr:alpha-ketoacid dehydrogenase subunit beta [Paracoccaceae bacterium]